MANVPFLDLLIHALKVSSSGYQGSRFPLQEMYQWTQTAEAVHILSELSGKQQALEEATDVSVLQQHTKLSHEYTADDDWEPRIHSSCESCCWSYCSNDWKIQLGPNLGRPEAHCDPKDSLWNGWWDAKQELPWGQTDEPKELVRKRSKWKQQGQWRVR